MSIKDGTFIGTCLELERKAQEMKEQIFWADTELAPITEIKVDKDGDIYRKGTDRWSIWVGKCAPSKTNFNAA